MARRFLEGTLHEETRPVLTDRDILAMRQEAGSVSIHEKLLAYAVKIAEETRNKAEIACGASPRALLSMLRCAQALAYLSDRDYCIPEDIVEAASLTIPHRLVLAPGARTNRIAKEDLVNKILTQVSVP